MNYYEEMSHKYGFQDGEAVPPDAWAARTVYVRALNVLLARHESQARVVAYDRPGFHNSCMIVLVTKGCHEQFGMQAVEQGLEEHLAEPDDAYYAAVEEAEELSLDQYVKVHVEIDSFGLDSALGINEQGSQQ